MRNASNSAGITLPAGVSEQVRATVTQAIKLSFVDGFRVVMFTSFALALLSALVAGLMIEGKRKTDDVKKSDTHDRARP